MFVSEIVGYDCYYKIGMKLSILFYWHPMECCLAELLLGAAPHYRECQIACMAVFAFLYCCNKLFGYSRAYICYTVRFSVFSR